jgi:hypothetical protein
MEFNHDQAMTLFGEKTPRTVIYKSESHKLHQAFPVKKDTKLYKGQLAAIDEDGYVIPYTGSEDQIYLGLAVTDSINPAYRPQRDYPAEVTVMVEAFALVNMVAKEAITKCGYVKPTESMLLERFPIMEASDDETKFINISTTDEANEIISVLVR